MHIDSGIVHAVFNDTVFSPFHLKNQICGIKLRIGAFHLVECHAHNVLGSGRWAKLQFHRPASRGLSCMPDPDYGTPRSHESGRAFPYAYGGYGIGCTAFFGYRIMIHHRIHISGRNQKPSLGTPSTEIASSLPVRLRNDSHRI